MFKKIRMFFINRMYNSCLEELTWTRRFYVVNILSDKGSFKDLDLVTRRRIFEEDVFVHIAQDVYPIYYKKFNDDFRSHLKMDAFGDTTIINETVASMFEESCKNAERSYR